MGLKKQTNAKSKGPSATALSRDKNKRKGKPSLKIATSKSGKSKEKTAPKAKPASVKTVPAKIAPVKIAPAKSTLAKLAPTKLAPAQIVPPSAPQKPAEPAVYESPAIDHTAALNPLFLAAGHGHLARSVDKVWLDALAKYRHALDRAVKYESSRSLPARTAMALSFGKQLVTLSNNLVTRMHALIQEAQSTHLDGAQRQLAKTGGQKIVTELYEMNRVLRSMVGPEGIGPKPPDGFFAFNQIDALQKQYFANIARFADLERTINGVSIDREDA